MTDLLQREFIYLRYYFIVQTEQIFPYWIIGMGIVLSCILGIASPLCMYGTIPIAASFSEKGMRHDWLAAFMMASILLNPQLVIYSAALGGTALMVRIAACFICGVTAGLLVQVFYKEEMFFDFSGFSETPNRDSDPNILIRYVKNFGRNIRATGLYFLSGIFLSTLFQRYIPADVFASLFGERSKGFGVLMAATVGVPLYACGGGTIPLLQTWLAGGMSMGSAAAFMITGPATKITNLGAVKTVLGIKKFSLYLVFSILFAFVTGVVVNLCQL